MTYQDNYGASTDGAFRSALASALAKAAGQISSEAPETAGHLQRVTLAHAVVTSPDPYAAQYAVSVAVFTGATPAALPDDPTLDGAVSSLWDAWAGVSVAVAQQPPANGTPAPPPPPAPARA